MSNRPSPPTTECSPKSKAWTEGTGKFRYLDPFSEDMGESLFALYQKTDPNQARARNKRLRKNAIRYYDAKFDTHGNRSKRVWCQVTGQWHHEREIEVAHIVPPIVLSFGSMCEILFGGRPEGFSQEQNALVLSHLVKYWYDRHDLVIVPWDATEIPITRWRTDVFPGIQEEMINLAGNTGKARDLSGKELIFKNQNRPSFHFLYFHFIMSLIQIKDLRKEGWKDVWARYYEQPPFPTPGPYMRKGMILALATHFEETDMLVIESWIVGNGFGLPLNRPLATEAARQVHMVIEDQYVQQQREDKEENSTDEEDKTAKKKTPTKKKTQKIRKTQMGRNNQLSQSDDQVKRLT